MTQLGHLQVPHPGLPGVHPGSSLGQIFRIPVVVAVLVALMVFAVVRDRRSRRRSP